jgi:hypothetical protein
LLIESLIGFAFLAAIALSITPTISTMLKRSYSNTYTDEYANSYLQAGIEAAYNIFLNNWTEYDYGAYQIDIDRTGASPFWVLVPYVRNTSGYDRKVEILRVKRHPITGIAGTGPEDPNSKLITVTVSWLNQKGVATNLTRSLLITNY